MRARRRAFSVVVALSVWLACRSAENAAPVAERAAAERPTPDAFVARLVDLACAGDLAAIAAGVGLARDTELPSHCPSIPCHTLSIQCMSAVWETQVSHHLDVTSGTLILATCGALSAAEARGALLVEAEMFERFGTWVDDSQFMDEMGSPFLLAHGLGVPVADATTTDEILGRGRCRKQWLRVVHCASRTARTRSASSLGSW